MTSTPTTGITAQDWVRLSALLDEALTLEPAARADWLQSLPAADAALAPALRELLARAAAETDEFMRRPALGSATQVARSLGAPVALAAGQAVGPYRLLRELGTGGMGAVWLAERADGTLRRQVALKLPRLAWAAGLAQRMARERDILAALEHPHIARLYDAGVDADGRPYLAMEVVEGRPIDQYVREQGLPVRARIALFLQVARAVAYAHARLTVHRDLKPSNILVTADGQVRLLDFGIAKLLAGDSAAETQLTELAGRALTPDYAAPEQIRGEPITVATDVYALGVVLFELLAGQRPYRLKRDSRGALEDAILVAEPPPASSLAAAADRRALAGDLDAILNKALKKAPAERYATTDALADDLQRHLDGLPVLARPDSLAYRLRKFGARHALALGAAGVVAFALLVGITTTLWQARVAAEERDRALAESRYSRVNHEVLMSMLDAGLKGGDARQWRTTLDQTRRLVEEQYRDDPGSQARLLLMLAGRYALLNDEPGEKQITASMASLLDRLEEPALRAQILCAQADLLLYRRDHQGAQPLVERALRELATVGDAGLTATADCYRTDANLAVEQGDLTRAIARGESLLATYEREGRQGSRLHLYMLLNLHRIYFDTDREVQMLALDEQLEAALARQGATNSMQHFGALDRRAAALLRQGRFLEAQAQLADTLQRLQAASDPQVLAVFWGVTGRRLIQTGAAAAGLPIVERTLADIVARGTRNQRIFSLFALTDGHLLEGDLSAAGQHIGELQQLFAQADTPARERAELARLTAQWQLQRGELGAAQAAIAELQVHASKLPVRARVEALRAEIVTAAVAIAARDRNGAERALERAVAAEQSGQRLAGAPASAWRGEIHRLRAMHLAQIGDTTAATAEAKLARDQLSQSVPADHPWRKAAESLRI
jgi:serine/threonine-protein kinase